MRAEVVGPSGSVSLLDVSAGEPVVAHYVRREDATRAYVTGEPIQALCGVVWVPSRDPEQFPMCERCDEAIAAMRRALR